MPSTYSSNLKIELQANGENAATWGDKTNTNLGTALEQAIVGYATANFTSDANLTLPYTDTSTSQVARALVLNVTSAVSLTVTRELIVPTIQKQYIVQNNTTGSQSITVKTSAGSGVTIPSGRKMHVYVDGTNVIQMFDFVTTLSMTNLSYTGTLTGGTGIVNLGSGQFYKDASGNVGIGTTSPSNRLDVFASADWQGRVVSNSGFNGGFIVEGNATGTRAQINLKTNNGTPREYYLRNVGGTFSLLDNTAGTIPFTVEAATPSNIIYANASGNLGIGTASPGSALDVRGSSPEVRIGQLGTPNAFALNWDNVNGFAKINTLGAAWPILFLQNSTERMRLDSSGNLGIGTASPSYRLDVAYDANANSSIRVSNSNLGTSATATLRLETQGGTWTINNGRNGGFLSFSDTGGERARFDNAGNLGIGTASPANYANYRNLAISGTTGANVDMLSGSTKVGNLFNDATNFYAYNVIAGALVFGTNNAERARFDSSGNLGIGTASPGERLDVRGGNIAAGNGTIKTALSYAANGIVGTLSNHSLSIYTNSLERAVFDTSGNLGIGTASPSYRLDVAYDANANSSIRVSNSNLGTSATATLRLETQGGTWTINNGRNGGFLSFSDTGGERARFDNAGNLGIGTASPAARLQVKSSLAQAVNIEGTSARGTGNIYAAFLDPTGRKGYFGYAASDDTFFVSNELSADILFQTNALNRMRITAAGNIVAGASAALATTATDGFLYVPTCAGTPTGTPTAVTGMAPIVVNTTNNKLYFYSGGAWRDAGP